MEHHFNRLQTPKAVENDEIVYLCEAYFLPLVFLFLELAAVLRKQKEKEKKKKNSEVAMKTFFFLYRSIAHLQGSEVPFGE